MSQKWEINRVSTPERIFQKITEEMAQPVGIILFGADCDLKDEVYMNCIEQIPSLAAGYGGKGNMRLRAAKTPFSENRSVLTVMCGESSEDHSRRHETVLALRDLGAKTVVGIYAKAEYYFPSDEAKRDPDEVARSRAMNNQILALKNNPPTADGLDYLIVVEEEKEG